MHAKPIIQTANQPDKGPTAVPTGREANGRNPMALLGLEGACSIIILLTMLPQACLCHCTHLQSQPRAPPHSCSAAATTAGVAVTPTTLAATTAASNAAAAALVDSHSANTTPPPPQTTPTCSPDFRHQFTAACIGCQVPHSDVPRLVTCTRHEYEHEGWGQ